MFISDNDPAINVCTNYCVTYDSVDEVDAYYIDVTTPKNYYNYSSCHISSLGIPFCHCHPRYSGSRCQVDKCHNYCLNEGKCSYSSNDLLCHCQSGYRGSRCQDFIQMYVYIQLSIKNIKLKRS